jgi:hypothetical protein
MAKCFWGVLAWFIFFTSVFVAMLLTNVNLDIILACSLLSLAVYVGYWIFMAGKGSY